MRKLHAYSTCVQYMRKLHVHITPKILYDWTQEQKPEQQQKEFPDFKNQ